MIWHDPTNQVADDYFCFVKYLDIPSLSKWFKRSDCKLLTSMYSGSFANFTNKEDKSDGLSVHFGILIKRLESFLFHYKNVCIEELDWLSYHSLFERIV